ncbi:MAG: metallophosphoesterase family protein [Candidatus Aenigmarchaeota archaeon]|nr:metallophosphoesterase family protein [Candidatus Aenigmarchaeota archaeon]
MNRKKIIELFFRRGKLLSEDTLSMLEKENEDSMPGILDRDYHELLLTPRHFQTENVSILKNLTSKPNLGREQQLGFYTSKYEKMRAILTQRLQKNFMSINKLGADRAEVFVIGIVKEKREEENKNIIDIEDVTGNIPVIFQGPVDCELDDVVAIQAISGGRVLFGKKILYPDIPLRNPSTGFGKACFISDVHLDEVPKKFPDRFFNWLEMEGVSFLFVAGDIGDTTVFQTLCGNKKTIVIPGNADTEEKYPYLPMGFDGKNIISLSNPAMIYLNGLKILIIHEFDMSMLKKRYLGKSEVILPEDYLVLDEVPDIVHYGHTHKPFVSNYKSTTLVNSGSTLTKFMPVVIDFSTREWKQAELDI